MIFFQVFGHKTTKQPQEDKIILGHHFRGFKLNIVWAYHEAEH